MSSELSDSDYKEIEQKFAPDCLSNAQAAKLQTQINFIQLQREILEMGRKARMLPLSSLKEWRQAAALAKEEKAAQARLDLHRSARKTLRRASTGRIYEHCEASRAACNVSGYLSILHVDKQTDEDMKNDFRSDEARRFLSGDKFDLMKWQIGCKIRRAIASEMTRSRVREISAGAELLRAPVTIVLDDFAFVKPENVPAWKVETVFKAMQIGSLPEMKGDPGRPKKLFRETHRLYRICARIGS